MRKWRRTKRKMLRVMLVEIVDAQEIEHKKIVENDDDDDYAIVKALVE